MLIGYTSKQQCLGTHELTRALYLQAPATNLADPVVPTCAPAVNDPEALPPTDKPVRLGCGGHVSVP